MSSVQVPNGDGGVSKSALRRAAATWDVTLASNLGLTEPHSVPEDDAMGVVGGVAMSFALGVFSDAGGAVSTRKGGFCP